MEPCCNYLCKLKDISRRLGSCAGAYNFISPKEGISTTKDVICGDGYFSQTHLSLDVCCLANQETDSALAMRRRKREGERRHDTGWYSSGKSNWEKPGMKKEFSVWLWMCSVSVDYVDLLASIKSGRFWP